MVGLTGVERPIFTYDLVVCKWSRTFPPNNHSYFVDAVYTPGSSVREWYGMRSSAANANDLTGVVIGTLEQWIAQGEQEDSFAISNLPQLACPAFTPGKDVLDMYFGFGEHVGIKPLDEGEFSQLQFAVESKFPKIWGTNSKPYSEKPLLTPEDEEFQIASIALKMERLGIAYELDVEMPAILKKLAAKYRGTH